MSVVTVVIETQRRSVQFHTFHLSYKIHQALSILYRERERYYINHTKIYVSQPSARRLQDALGGSSLTRQTGHVSLCAEAKNNSRQSGNILPDRDVATHQFEPIPQTILMEYVFTLWYPLHARPGFKVAQAHRARRFARRLVHLHRLQRLHHRRIRRRVKVSRVKLCKVNVTKRRDGGSPKASGEDDG